MLGELDDIITKATGAARDGIERDIRAAARILLDRQFVYSDDHTGQRRFELIRRHRVYFGNLFDALGFDLVVDDREQMVGIVSQSGAGARRMTVQESIFLLALRVIYDERLRSFSLAEGGRCEAKMTEVWGMIEERTGRERPSVGRSRLLVEQFRRNGLVREASTTPDGDIVLEIRPAITKAIGSASAESLEQYARGYGVSVRDSEAVGAGAGEEEDGEIEQMAGADVI